jgi:hypothetical protein
MPVIAFESIDGAETSMVADAFARLTGGIALRKLSMHGDWARERKAVNLGFDPDARFGYFLRLNRDRMAVARWLSGSGHPAILEGGVHGTVATHRVLGSAAAWEYDIDESDLLPDHVILLGQADDERPTGLGSRDGGLVYASHWDEWLSKKVGDVSRELGRFELPTLDASRPIDELMGSVRELVGV